MALIARRSTNPNTGIRIKSDPTNLNIGIRTGARTRREVTKVNIETKTDIETKISIAPALLRTRINMEAVAAVRIKTGTRTRRRRAALPRVKTRSIRAVAVPLAKTRTRIRRDPKIRKEIITSLAPVQRIRTSIIAAAPETRKRKALVKTRMAPVKTRKRALALAETRIRTRRDIKVRLPHPRIRRGARTRNILVLIPPLIKTDIDPTRISIVTTKTRIVIVMTKRNVGSQFLFPF